MSQEILYAYDIVLIAESMAEMQESFYGWKRAFESKDLKVNLMKTKVMVSKIRQVTVKPSSKKDSCDIYGRKTMLSAVLCKFCGRCANIKRVTNRRAIDFRCMKCKGYHQNMEDQKEKLHDDVERVTEFSYLGDRINTGGAYDEAVATRSRIGLSRFKEYQDLLCGKKLSLKIIGIAYKSCVISAMLYECVTWCLGKNDTGIFHGTKRSMVSNMCGVILMDMKSKKDLMQMMDLNEANDQLANANSVRWYGHVFRKDENNFLRRAFNLIVKGTTKSGRQQKSSLRAVIEQSKKVGLNEGDAINRSKWRLAVNTISSMVS